jgi:hypothetical protein
MSTNAEKYPIREDWEEYYKFLEAIRRTGVCNMWGAYIYLVEAFHMSNEESKEILVNWIENYSALNDKYGWQK